MHPRKSGIRVLYVDDELFLHDPFKLLMEKDGEFSVDAVSSAKEGLDRLSAEPYDAVVSDYQMPVMDGIAFLKHLRRTGKRIPFILFTARGREEVVIEAINSGVDSYMQKGGDVLPQFAELTHSIRSAVEKKEAEEDIIVKEEQLSAFFDSSVEMLGLFDVEGRVMRINKAAEKLMGVPGTELAGKKLSESRLPGGKEGALATIENVFTKVVNEGVMVHHDEVSKRENGDAVYLSVDTVPVRDASGKITFVASVARDVTENTRSYALIKAIRDASIAVLRERPLNDILSYLCGTIAEIFDFKVVGIFLKEDNGSLTLLSRAENAPGSVLEKIVRWDESPGGQTSTGRAIRTGKIQIKRIDEPDLKQWREDMLKDGYNSVISIPLFISRNETIGAMGVGGNDLDRLSEGMIAQLENAADGVSVAIQSSRHREKLRLLEAALESSTDTVVLTNREGIIEWQTVPSPVRRDIQLMK
jgi:PAS domain S-box-containing protein